MKKNILGILSILISILGFVSCSALDEDMAISEDEFGEIRKYKYYDSDIKYCPVWQNEGIHKAFSKDSISGMWVPNSRFLHGLEYELPGLGKKPLGGPAVPFNGPIPPFTRYVPAVDSITGGRDVTSLLSWPYYLQSGVQGSDDRVGFDYLLPGYDRFIINKGSCPYYKIQAIFVGFRCYNVVDERPGYDGELNIDHTYYLDDYEIGEEIYDNRFGGVSFFNHEDALEVVFHDRNATPDISKFYVSFIIDFQPATYRICEHLELIDVDHEYIQRKEFAVSIYNVEHEYYNYIHSFR